MELAIIPECYIDTNLLETIAPPLKRYNHQHGCSTVAKLMQEKFKDKFAVGIVDKDKKELKYSNEFELIIDLTDLQLYKHKNIKIHHYLILIIPAIEIWILNNANEVNLLLSDFELPDDLKELTKITKKITSRYDKKFKMLFDELLKRKAKKVLILSEWIKYLKDNNYKINIDELKSLTTMHF